MMSRGSSRRSPWPIDLRARRTYKRREYCLQYGETALDWPTPLEPAPRPAPLPRHEFPRAAAKITDDLDVLLEFYNYPAEHWVHLRTTNPIEYTFSTVRLRTKVTRGAGSRSAALAMTFKLIESAHDRWRAVNAPHLVALVRAGARFEHGTLV